METKANYVLIGAFTIAGFLGLLLFLMWFAKLELNRQFAWYDIYFQEVSGLSPSSDVTFAGLSVGRVAEIRLSGNENGPVRVRIEVAEDTPVRVDSRASVESQAVTGISTVAITAGTPEAPLLREASADPVPVIAANRSALQTLSDQGPEMISRLNTVAEQLTELLGEQNQARVNAILGNVERSSGNLDKSLSDISRATDSIASAAADISEFGTRIGTLGDAAERTLARTDSALDSGTKALDTVQSYVEADLRPLTRRLGQTADTLQTDLTRLTNRADRSMDSLDKALEIGNRTLAAAERAFDGADRVINTDVGPVMSDLRVTLGKANEAIDQVVVDLPQITGQMRIAAESASAAFGTMNTLLAGISAPVQDFARNGLAQITRLTGDMRDLVGNMNRLVTGLRRNPSQIISGPNVPEFRR
ncbi:MlaD family protein [Paracoccus sp. (in: a-proteobacteria)]|uniref:MlaD family protein n=1 Tax=Paracoccus sp. TaxID=267 RepID=UPI0032207A25